MNVHLLGLIILDEMLMWQACIWLDPSKGHKILYTLIIAPFVEIYASNFTQNSCLNVHDTCY